MIRSELIKVLQKRLKMRIKNNEDIKLSVDNLIDYMRHSLVSGERFEIRGFGSFTPKIRSSRMGRNPKTGENIQLEQRSVIHFKPGKELKILVDDVG